MEKPLRIIIQRNKTFLLENVNLWKIKPVLRKYMIFTETMLNTIYDGILLGECDFYDELCSRGPTAFQLFVEVLRRTGYLDIAGLLEGEVPKNSNYLYYIMNSTPLGFCKIINNFDFQDSKTKFDDRFGSQMDATRLEYTFEGMGFHVSIAQNLTADEMRGCLSEFSQQTSFQGVHSSVVIVLTHGKNVNNCDVLFGVDGKFVRKFEIYSLFDNKTCKHLRFKPKMFFFQACRGNKDDEGVIYDENKITKSYISSEDTPESEDTSFCSSLTDDENEITSYISSEDTPESDECASFYPSMTDMFIVHSSLPYHVSFLHPEKGSFFCQDLVNVFSKYYRNQDLNALIVLISKRMIERVSCYYTKQAIHFEQIAPMHIVHFCRTRTGFRE